MGSKVLARGPHVGDLAVAVDDQAIRLDVLPQCFRDGLREAGNKNYKSDFAVTQLMACFEALSLVHTSRRLQRLSQRARSLQIIGKLSIFTAMDCNSCWLQQIHS